MPTVEVNLTSLEQPINIVIEAPKEPTLYELFVDQLGVICAFLFGMYAITFMYRIWLQPLLWIYLEEHDERSKLERADGRAPMESRAMSLLRSAAGMPEKEDAGMRLLQEESSSKIKRLLGSAVAYLQGRKGGR